MIYKGNNIIKTYLGDGDVKKLYYHDNVCYYKVTKGDEPTPPTPHDYSQDYLTFVALEDGTFSFSGASTANCLSYSTDSGATWSEPARYITTPTITNGNTVMWKGSGMSPKSGYGIGTFCQTATRFDAQGNIMSLIFGDNFSGQTDLTGYAYVFYELFGSYNRRIGSKIVNAENMILPATTLTNSCYQNMFFYCSSITTAPILPATTLKLRCYRSMFCNCTSLVKSPILPATNLILECYIFMFDGCTSLNSITCLAEDISESRCTYNWTRNVAANGTFTKAPSMSSWTTGADGIPNGWTVVDYSG